MKPPFPTRRSSDLALVLRADIEGRALAEVLEVLRQPAVGGAPADVEEVLQEGPLGVHLAGGAQRIDVLLRRDAVHQHLLVGLAVELALDRKSTRLNSSH